MEKLVIKHFEERIRTQEYLSRRKMKQLPEHVEGRLLEIGCGARLTYAPRTTEVCGIDISLEMARHFKKNHPGYQMVVADAKALPFRKKSFNVVVMNTVIHHLVGGTPSESLHNAKIALREVKRIIDKLGIVLIVELLAGNNILSFLMFYITVLFAKFGISIDLLDIHSRVVTFFLTDSALKQISSDAGFSVMKLESSAWKLLKFKLGQQVTYSLNLNSS